MDWGPVVNGHADIRGVSREVIDHFSQRRQKILEHMGEHGGRTAAAAQIAALASRGKKLNIGGDRLRELWRARAQEHGLDAPAVERVPRTAHPVVPIANDVRPETLTHQASTFGRPELLQALAEAQPRGARISDLERIADRMLHYRQIVALPPGKAPAGLTEPRYTTTDLLASEQDLLDRADRWRGSGVGTVHSSRVETALERRSLSREQEAVVKDLCGGGDGVSVVRAAAGTGKTFVLDAAREAWQGQGVQVVGCALSARAALELDDQSAIASVTMAQLTGRLGDGVQLPRGGVLVVDEAGMVGTRDLARLAEAAELARAKLVLVGDDRQLPEILAGGSFHALADRLPKNELREVRRQEHAWDRAALDELRSGEVERWARAYRDHGHITVGDTAAATRAALINDWSRSDGDKLMIAARREDVADLNQRARNFLQECGDLSPDQLTAAGRGYTPGDRVIGARNDRQAGILNGQRGTVTGAHPDWRALDVRLDNGADITLGPDYLAAGHLDHGYAITAHRAQGATVDRTFVLGSEELYYEWGYTAMSRHRHDARFYVAGSDIAPNLELPAPHDPVIEGITQLLQRSRTKDLALESLPLADREQLERERRELREQLTDHPPPARRSHREESDSSRVLYVLENAIEDENRLLEQRERLRWHERAARIRIDSRLEESRKTQQSQREQLGALDTRHGHADAIDRAWATTYADEASRLLSVSAELHARDHIEERVLASTRELHPDPLTPQLPELTHDLGLHLGP